MSDDNNAAFWKWARSAYVDGMHRHASHDTAFAAWMACSDQHAAALAAKDAEIATLRDYRQAAADDAVYWKARASRAEQEAIELWARIYRLEAEVKGPDGFATWQDAATDERVRRVRAEQEAAGLRADAERWQFLLTLTSAQWAELGQVPDSEIDAAIDAARAGGGQ